MAEGKLQWENTTGQVDWFIIRIRYSEPKFTQSFGSLKFFLLISCIGNHRKPLMTERVCFSFDIRYSIFFFCFTAPRVFCYGVSLYFSSGNIDRLERSHDFSQYRIPFTFYSFDTKKIRRQCILPDRVVQ